MRYRVKTDLSDADVMYYSGNCYTNGVSPPCPVDAVPYAYINSRTHEAMLDVPTANFKELSAAGEIVNSPMVREKYRYYGEASNCDGIGASSGIDAHYRGFYFPTTCGVPWLMGTNTVEMWDDIEELLEQFESERSIAITKAWANVDESEMLALASLGELPETLSWMRDLYKRFIVIIRIAKAKKLKLALAKAAGRGSIALADDLANFWLELRYALRPLMMEMDQIVSIINGDKAKQIRNTARGFWTVSDNDDTTTEISSPTSPWVICDKRVVSTRKSEYRAGVLYSIQLDNLGLSDVLGLDQVLESAYELTKLSFMIDWFLNVGDTLSSFTRSSNLLPLTSWVTEKHTWTSTVTLSNPVHTYDAGAWKYRVVAEDMHGEYEQRIISRRLVEPAKKWYPRLAVNLDWAKTLDILAIARGFYRAFSQS